jgi:HSP20 family protein
MSNLTRRQHREIVSLREAMDRLFEESVLSPTGDAGARGFMAPAVDISETNDEIVVTATVPGINPDDLHISVTGDVLEMRGEVKQESERKEATWHLRERRSGSFARSIMLPTPVVADEAQAEFENGVLTLTLPKAQDARRKTIKVRANRETKQATR